MLKKIFLISLIAVFSFGFDYHLKPKQISKSVWQFVGVLEPVKKSNGGNIANTYWVKTEKHWVVIDTGATYDYAKEAYQIMQKIAPLPIAFVVNTHSHDDHWMGNSFYKEKNIPIYGTKLQKDSYKVGGESRILKIVDKKDLKGTKIVPIDKIIDKDMEVKVDGETFKFIHLNHPAHTKEDIMVYFPKERVLFTGDLLFSERLTSIRDGTIEGSLKAFDKIEKINPLIYANGHGKYIDKRALNFMRSYLTDLKKLALKAIEDEVEMEDFIKSANKIMEKKYKKYKLFKLLNKDNLGYAFREYEFFEEE